MEQTNLLSLPVEVIHQISSYLSVEDVLSCSLTCNFLSNALNADHVWRKYLPKQDLSSLKYLEHKVSPGFEENKSLCKNKLLYAKKNHLINNWKSGHFVEDTIRTEFRYASGVFNRLKGVGHLFYKGRYLFLGRFINDIHSDAIEVWDIENIPACKYSVIPIVDEEYNHFCIIDSYLVVVECVKVYVYQINLPEKSFPLLYSFFITDTNVTVNDRVEHSGRHDFLCVGWRHSTVEHFFLSNKGGENILHVWDICRGSKVGSFISPINSFSIELTSYNGNNWLLAHTLHVGNGQFYLYFNIEKHTFSKNIFSYQGCPSLVILYEDHIILFESSEPNSKGWCDTVCKVFDFNTSQELKKRRFNNARRNHNIQSTQVINGKLVILCFDCIQIINALTLETIDYFRCDDVSFSLREISLFGSVLFLTANIYNTMDVWNIESKKRLPFGFNHVYTDHLFFNELFTKVVCVGSFDITVYHFW